MSPPEDAPVAARLSRWLDGWFAPRWRALLTWVVLVTLGAVVLENFADPRIRTMVLWSTGLVNHWLSTPLPAAVTHTAMVANAVLLLAWFEPLALRLSLPRGVAWLGLRIAQFVVNGWAFQSTRLRFAYGILLLFGVARVPVLLGWRSRPWMVVISAALLMGYTILNRKVHFPYEYHLQPVLASLFYAVPLLYGTRLLRPEKRVPTVNPVDDP